MKVAFGFTALLWICSGLPSAISAEDTKPVVSFEEFFERCASLKAKLQTAKSAAPGIRIAGAVSGPSERGVRPKVRTVAYRVSVAAGATSHPIVMIIDEARSCRIRIVANDGQCLAGEVIIAKQLSDILIPMAETACMAAQEAPAELYNRNVLGSAITYMAVEYTDGAYMLAMANEMGVVSEFDKASLAFDGAIARINIAGMKLRPCAAGQ